LQLPGYFNGKLNLRLVALPSILLASLRFFALASGAGHYDFDSASSFLGSDWDSSWHFARCLGLDWIRC
jgi:hypothetical protein